MQLNRLVDPASFHASEPESFDPITQTAITSLETAMRKYVPKGTDKTYAGDKIVVEDVDLGYIVSMAQTLETLFAKGNLTQSLYRKVLDPRHKTPDRTPDDVRISVLAVASALRSFDSIGYNSREKMLNYLEGVRERIANDSRDTMRYPSSDVMGPTYTGHAPNEDILYLEGQRRV